MSKQTEPRQLVMLMVLWIGGIIVGGLSAMCTFQSNCLSKILNSDVCVPFRKLYIPTGRSKIISYDENNVFSHLLGRAAGHEDLLGSSARDLYRLRSRANLRSRSRSAVGGYAVSVKAEPIEKT